MLFRRYFSVLGVVFLRGGGAGLAVLFTVLISRYLPTESAARFFFLFNVSTIAAVCFRWGLDEVIIRRVAGLHTAEVGLTVRQLVLLSHRRVLIWLFVSVLVFFAASCTSALPFKAGDSLQLICALNAAAFLALTACAARILQGRGYTNRAAFLLNIAVPGLSVLGLLVLVKFEFLGAGDLIAFYLGVSAFIYIFVKFVFFRLYKIDFLRILSSRSDRADASAANKLGVVVLAQQAIAWTALLAIPYFYGDDYYKAFVVVQKFSAIIGLAMLAVNFTFSRYFASLYATGEILKLQAMVRISFLIVVLSGVFVILCLIFFWQWIFKYSQISPDMVGLLFVLLAGQLFFSVSALFSVILSMARDDNYLFFVQSVVNGAGSIAFLVFCQFFSLEFASMVLVVSYFLLCIFLGWRVHVVIGFGGAKV